MFWHTNERKLMIALAESVWLSCRSCRPAPSRLTQNHTLLAAPQSFLRQLKQKPQRGETQWGFCRSPAKSRTDQEAPPTVFGAPGLISMMVLVISCLCVPPSLHQRDLVFSSSVGQSPALCTKGHNSPLWQPASVSPAGALPDAAGSVVSMLARTALGVTAEAS